MLSHYFKAAALKSLQSAPSLSQSFEENIFIILDKLFYGLGDFCLKALKIIKLNNNLKFWLRLAIFPYLEVTWVRLDS